MAEGEAKPKKPGLRPDIATLGGIVLAMAGIVGGLLLLWIALKLIVDHRFIAVILWALCYGLGFGAGLGVAFHVCQAPARTLLRKSSPLNVEGNPTPEASKHGA